MVQRVPVRADRRTGAPPIQDRDPRASIRSSSTPVHSSGVTSRYAISPTKPLLITRSGLIALSFPRLSASRGFGPMQATGFLGTRADAFVDVAVVFFLAAPFLMALALRLAARRRYHAHRRLQTGVLLGAIAAVLLLEGSIRFGGAMDAFALSSFHGTTTLAGLFGVHLAVAIPTFVAWCGPGGPVLAPVPGRPAGLLRPAAPALGPAYLRGPLVHLRDRRGPLRDELRALPPLRRHRPTPDGVFARGDVRRYCSSRPEHPLRGAMDAFAHRSRHHELAGRRSPRRRDPPSAWCVLAATSLALERAAGLLRARGTSLGPLRGPLFDLRDRVGL